MTLKSSIAIDLPQMRAAGFFFTDMGIECAVNTPFAGARTVNASSSPLAAVRFASRRVAVFLDQLVALLDRGCIAPKRVGAEISISRFS